MFSKLIESAMELSKEHRCPNCDTELTISNEENIAKFCKNCGLTLSFDDLQNIKKTTG